MSTSELRERLIEKIQQTNDENILQEAYRLLDLEANTEKVYQLRDNQKTQIESCRSEIKEGKFLTNDEANNQIDEWLNK